MTSKSDAPSLAATPVASSGRRVIAVAFGALLVALAAQVRVPLPFTPVPATLQDLTVLVVGGVFGAAAGLGALVAYLAMGLAGMPVFAGGASGLAWLMGPTGGYLLAFPVAAYVVGVLSRRGGFARALLAASVGMLVIHLGGVAQLAVLTGSAASAVQLGSAPFLAAGVIKVGLAAAMIAGLSPRFARWR